MLEKRGIETFSLILRLIYKEGGQTMVMDWLSWALLVGGLIGLFVLWDLVFCGGKYCKRFGDRL